MNLTDYHAKYFAHELTQRYPPDGVEKFAGALASAQVDLNPHQTRQWKKLSLGSWARDPDATAVVSTRGNLDEKW